MRSDGPAIGASGLDETAAIYRAAGGSLFPKVRVTPNSAELAERWKRVGNGSRSFRSRHVPLTCRQMTYTGGYVLPGTTPGAGQVALPADLESAAVEQVAAWFQQRDRLGLIRYWPSGGTFLVFAQLPLLAQVTAALRPHQRWAV